MTQLTKMRQAKRTADQIRAMWLWDIHTTRASDHPVTMRDLLVEACTPAGRPLGRIRLTRLLQAGTGCSRLSAGRMINQLLATIGGTINDQRDLTVRWLLDPRSGGRRIIALADVLHMRDGVPWPGFPFAPRSPA